MRGVLIWRSRFARFKLVMLVGIEVDKMELKASKWWLIIGEDTRVKVVGPRVSEGYAKFGKFEAILGNAINFKVWFTHGSVSVSVPVAWMKAKLWENCHDIELLLILTPIKTESKFIASSKRVNASTDGDGCRYCFWKMYLSLNCYRETICRRFRKDFTAKLFWNDYSF